MIPKPVVTTEDADVVNDVPVLLPPPVPASSFVVQRETRLRDLLKAKGFMAEPPPAPEPKRGRSPPRADAHRRGWREVLYGPVNEDRYNPEAENHLQYVWDDYMRLENPTKRPCVVARNA